VGAEEFKKEKVSHSVELTSKVSGGWRNDTVFTRLPDGRRLFQLYDLKQLPAVDPSDRSAIEFDAMLSHLKAMNLADRLLGEKKKQ
jgi:hypothetical protein